MEKCSHGSLDDVVAASKAIPVSEARAARWAGCMLRALRRIHHEGIVHRDIKPGNFMMTSVDDGSSELKVVDFGLCAFWQPGDKLLEPTTGTPYFMAPELIQHRYGSPADIWSVGAVLYVLLSGRFPFLESAGAWWAARQTESYTSLMTRGIPTKELHNLLRAIVTGPLDLTSDPWPRVSAEAKTLVQRLMDRDPGTRYSAEQALNESPWLPRNEKGEGTLWGEEIYWGPTNQPPLFAS